MNNSKKFNVLVMVEIALITAVISAVSPFTVPLPFSPVPLSLSILAIYIGLYALGWKWGTVSILLYILIGLVGVPVFSNFSSGPEKLMGPTGGYIIGYIFIGIITGLFIDLFEKKIYMHVIGMVLGVAVCYLFGTIHFVRVMEGHTMLSALGLCVFPYIPGDILKIVAAVIIGPILKRRLKKLKVEAVNNNQ